MKENEIIDNSFEEFASNKRRRELLPWWIKLFCWFFMLFGIMAFVCLILGFTNIKPALAFYGFESNEPFSLNGMLVITVGILKGITAFALWFEKDFAIKLGKIDAIVGIIICGISMLILPFLNDGFNIQIRLELALLIPFLLKLNKIEKEWESITK
jgi:Trk-type K+ transport system membrane component